MKKKILFSILTFVLLAILCVMPVFAASATANVSSVSGNRGATVTVSVSLSKATTVGSGGIELKYDTAVLELVEGKWNVSGTTLSNFNPSNGKGAFAYASGTQISGKVFTATFKVKSNAAFGASTVKMTLQLKDGSNADISVTNNSGKVTVTCKHSYSKWSSVNGTSHTRTCSICNQPETKNHAFTNACDTSCNDCGYTRTTTHNYKTTWSSNGSQHWHECSVCKDKKDAANHIPGTAATETTPQKCTVCNHVLAEAAGHTHTYGNTWSNDANGHWNTCTSCGEGSSVQAHIFDNACDTSCNTCAYERNITHNYGEDYASDSTSHWHTCTVCTAKSEGETHSFENACDTDCKDCGYVRETEHSYDSGKVTKEPSQGVVGEKTYTCSLCDDKKIVELEYYAMQDGANGSSANSVIFAVVGAVIGAAVGFVVAMLIFKKKNV